MAQQYDTAVAAGPYAVDLKSEVEAAIRPYLDSEECPPFSLPELSVMAWVCRRNHLDMITQKEIFQWVMMTFRHYRAFVVDGIHKAAHSVIPKDFRAMKLSRLVHDLTSAICGHEAPMHLVHHKLKSERRPTYISTLADSRIYLRRALVNEPKSFPRFLDLPAELRLMVYDELFRVDGVSVYSRGLLCKGTRYGRGFQVVRECPRKISDQISDGTGDWMLAGNDTFTAPPEELLSLVLANRQIFQEAMPVFYNVNTFEVQDFLELMRLLRFCGARRRAQFAHIRVRRPDATSRATAKKAFDLLAEVKQLQSLKVWVDDRPLRVPPPIEPQSVYWVKWLCKLSVPSLHIEGDGGRIETYIREQRALKGSKAADVKPKKRSSTRSGGARAIAATKAKKATSKPT